MKGNKSLERVRCDRAWSLRVTWSRLSGHLQGLWWSFIMALPCHNKGDGNLAGTATGPRNPFRLGLPRSFPQVLVD